MKIKLFLLSIYLNGYKYKIFITQPTDIYHLLIFLSYQKELIIVEHNGKIHNNSNKDPKYIKQKDKIEIITIVGGG
uniref:hypothetical protein n=1 Tax=Desmarestia aculeata TaxID=62298 RepID=UPI002E7A49C6|nr:hypothetical protein V2483_pgp006 [Desmarestia aculeata]WAM62970.1 hypothetical protein [Desmarestia aculeata]